MKKEDVIEFVKDWIHSIWELQEEEHLARFYSLDVEGDFNGEAVNFEGLKEKLSSFYIHLKKVEIEVKQLIVEKSKFALRALQHYELKDGKTITLPSMIFAHLKEGKISKYWLKTRHPFLFEDPSSQQDTA